MHWSDVYFTIEFDNWNQLSIHLCILILITRSFLENLTWKFFIPPTYFHDFWHYQDVNTNFIGLTIDIFVWGIAFVNTNVNGKVLILNKTILNILSNFISVKTLIADDKDLPWFTKEWFTKNFLRNKNIPLIPLLFHGNEY